MMIRKNYATGFLTFFALLIFCGVALAQDPQPSLVVSANGQGKIKLGKEEFNLNAVVVKGFQDGKVEINLVTDITVFISGSWSRANENDKTIAKKRRIQRRESVCLRESQLAQIRLDKGRV